MLAIHNIKTTLMINKLRYVRVCILELSKTPMCQFHFDYIKKKNMPPNQDYYSQILTSWRMKLKLKMFIRTIRMKKCLILIIFSAESECYNNSNTLVVNKMNDKIAVVAVEEFVKVKNVINSSKYEKAKDVNKNDVKVIINIKMLY